MKNSQLRTAMCVVGVVIMLIAFVVVPDEYPWFYELILFNIGMFMWLFAKKGRISKIKSRLFSSRA